MPDLLLFLLSALWFLGFGIAGGWVLRGLRDKMRAEAKEDAEWDERHA